MQPINPEHLETVPDEWTVEAWCAYLELRADEHLRAHLEIVEAIERFKRADFPGAENQGE